jgi:hypothetical protein
MGLPSPKTSGENTPRGYVESSYSVEMVEVSFEVEQAGCASCAGRVRDALAPLLEISGLEIDESLDAALITAQAVEEPTVGMIDQLLTAASEGAGHKYRVRPGSLRVVS